MKNQQDKYAYGSGVFPDWLATNTTGPGLTDGSPYVADNINDGWEGVSQAIMQYAAGNGLIQKTNTPVGSVGVPNGITEARGVSQILQAIQKGHGIGPGGYVPYGGRLASETGRVILLNEQGVLITDYPALDEACYVGDGNNTSTFNSGGYFYRSSDAAGNIPNIAGPYLQLPPQPMNTYLWEYDANGIGIISSLPNYTTVNYTKFLLFQTANFPQGIWILGYLDTNFQAANRTGVTWTISNIVFSGARLQQVATSVYNGPAFVTFADTYCESNQITITHANTGTTRYATMFKARLNTTPTWAKNFLYKWGIRY